MDGGLFESGEFKDGEFVGGVRATVEDEPIAIGRDGIFEAMISESDVAIGMTSSSFTKSKRLELGGSCLAVGQEYL